MMDEKLASDAYDVMRIREDFPALREMPYGKPLVYLDNAASAQKPRPCSTACVTPTSTNTPMCIAACIISPTRRPTLSRRRGNPCGPFLNAELTDEIIFTRSAHGSLKSGRRLFRSRAYRRRRRDRLSMMEHHSNIVPWHFQRERKGAVLKWIDVDDDGHFELDEFEKRFTPRTKIVAITHMSNVLGDGDARCRVASIAHAHGVPSVVDGSQGAVHLDVDVRALDVDFYVVTGHKLYGPTGIGALYGKRKWLEDAAALRGGGEMIETVTLDTVTYNAPPHRFEAGTPPIVQAVGLGRRSTMSKRSARAHPRA